MDALIVLGSISLVVLSALFSVGKIVRHLIRVRDGGL